MHSVSTIRCEYCNYIHVLRTVVIIIIIQVDVLLFFHKRTHDTFGRTPLVGWLKPYMVPEILGVSLPEAYLAGAPPVNKLTLLKSNKDLWEGDEEKRTGPTESCVEEEKMDTQSCEKTKRKQRRKNQQDKACKWKFRVDLKTVRRLRLSKRTMAKKWKYLKVPEGHETGGKKRTVLWTRAKSMTPREDEGALLMTLSVLRVCPIIKFHQYCRVRQGYVMMRGFKSQSRQ